MNLKNFVQSYIHDTYIVTKDLAGKDCQVMDQKNFYRLSNNQDSFIVMANPSTQGNAKKKTTHI